MKPTISIFEDEIVITTDSFDLILKTNTTPTSSIQPPSVPPNVGREDHEPYDNMGEIDWDNDPFAPSMDSLEKSIAEYKEQHPEQFPFGRTDKRVVNVATEKAEILVPPATTQPPSVSIPIAIGRGMEETPASVSGLPAKPIAPGDFGKRTREHPAKPCIVCGNDFKPTWNTQRYCPACKPKYYGQKRKPLAEQTTEELEQTLKDIENRRKKPYEFK
jgi:hypothetical protein